MSARPRVIATPGRPPSSKTPTRKPAVSGNGLSPWLYVVLVVVLCAGGLFGYDQGVISGALAGIKSTFTLSALLVEGGDQLGDAGRAARLPGRRRIG